MFWDDINQFGTDHRFTYVSHFFMNKEKKLSMSYWQDSYLWDSRAVRAHQYDIHWDSRRARPGVHLLCLLIWVISKGRDKFKSKIMIHHEPDLSLLTGTCCKWWLHPELRNLDLKFWFQSWRFCFQFSLKMVSLIKDRK